MTRTIDEIGNRYGSLVVVSAAVGSQGGRRWVCACDCGTERVCLGRSLRQPDGPVSCGCKDKRRDFTALDMAKRLGGFHAEAYLDNVARVEDGEEPDEDVLLAVEYGL